MHLRSLNAGLRERPFGWALAKELTASMPRDEAELALAIAAEVLAADPAIGPLETLYVDSQQEVLARRFALFVYAEKKIYFYDRDRGSLHSVALVGSSQFEPFELLLEKAKMLARSKRLGNLFVVRRDRTGFFANA